MDAAQSDKGRHRGSMGRAGSIRRASRARSFRQTTNGIAQFLRGTSPREQAETDSDDDECEEEDYFHTLVTRGAALKRGYILNIRTFPQSPSEALRRKQECSRWQERDWERAQWHLPSSPEPVNWCVSSNGLSSSRQQPSREPASVDRGVLTVHVKDCKDFKNLSVKKGTQSFVRVSVGGKVKCTRLQQYKDHQVNDNKVAIVFNEWKYFSIRIPRAEGCTLDPAQRIVLLELIFFEQDSGIPKLIGKTFVKLHDMINKERATMHVDLKLSRQVICKLDLEMVITYGTFGYGYSHQLQHPKRSMDSFVDRSLYLRCPPPEDRMDERYNVLTPRPMPHIDIIESLMRRETADPDAPDSHHIYPTTVMNQLQRHGRLLQLHEKFHSYQSQANVIQDLEKMILKRGLQASSSWRQNKKSKKILNRWKNKASLIPKLLGFAASDARKSNAGQDAEGEESTPAPRAKSPLLAAVLRANRTAEAEQRQPADATAPAPTSRWSVARAKTEEQEEQEEEAVVSGMNSLSLSSEKPLSTTATSSSRGASPNTSPGPAALSGPAAPSSPLGSFWGKLKGTGGATEPAEDASPDTPAPGRLNLPWSSSPAQSAAPSAPTPPPPPARTADPSPGVVAEDDPTEMWLRAPASIPSLSSMLSDKDLEPIKSSLSFSPPPSSSSSPQAAGSAASLMTSGGYRPKPGWDKLKTAEGSSAPYRKQSHPR